MKRIRLFPIYLFCLLPFAGCKKWLDVRPATQIREETLFETEQGFKDALTGVYTQLTGGEVYGSTLTMTYLDVLAQRYNVNTGHDFYQASIYNYEDAGNKNRHAAIWRTGYNSIANINKILENIDQKKGIFSGNNYSLIKGEALALRAFLHFDLVRMFGASFAGHSQTKSIPYIKVVSLKVTPLSTVEEVIGHTVNDLKEAELLLSVVPGIDPLADYATRPANGDAFLIFRQNRINYWAAKALLARVLLYKGDKPGALKYAQEVINSGKFRFTTAGELSGTPELKDRTYSREHIFSLYISDLTPVVNQYFKSRSVAGGSSNTHVLTQTPAALQLIFEGMGSTDVRFLYGFEHDEAQRFPGKLWQQNNVREIFRRLMPIIRLPEMYYIAAESTTDETQAVNFLNAVRTKRGIPALGQLSTTEIQAEILKEYQKEFYCEGQLFYYYKRKNAARIEGTTITPTNKVYTFPLPVDESQFGGR